MDDYKCEHGKNPDACVQEICKLRRRLYAEQNYNASTRVELREAKDAIRDLRTQNTDYKDLVAFQRERIIDLNETIRAKGRVPNSAWTATQWVLELDAVLYNDCTLTLWVNRRGPPGETTYEWYILGLPRDIYTNRPNGRAATCSLAKAAALKWLRNEEKTWKQAKDHEASKEANASA